MTYASQSSVQLKLSNGWSFPKTAVLTALVIGTTGCQTLEQGARVVKDTFANTDPCGNSARNIGIAAGGLAGAAAGYAVSDAKAGIVVGAAAGAALGGLIGHNIDQRRCELSKIASANQLEMAITNLEMEETVPSKDGVSQQTKSKKIVGMSVSVIDNGEQFASSSSTPNAKAKAAFTQIAQAYRIPIANASSQEKATAAQDLSNMRLLLIGHTDDTGNSQKNADLSEARAKEVAKIFASNGFSKNQIFYQGAGETLPIANNNTEKGRAQNRRVEIVDLSNDDTFEQYLANRRPNVGYYRNSSDVPKIEAEPPVVAAASRAKLGKTTNVTLATKRGGAKGTPTQTVPAPKNMIGTTVPAKAKSTTAPKPNVIGSPVKSAGVSNPSSKAGDSDSTVVSKDIEAAVSNVLPSKKLPAGTREFDFGGTAFTDHAVSVNIGSLKPKSVLSFISSAYAEMPNGLGSCLNDRPRASNSVKSLETGRSRKLNNVADYMPGLFNNSWQGMAGEHLVALTHMAVLRDGGAPAHAPELLVFSQYKGGNAKPDFKKSPDVNTYVGDSALLYRIFVNGPIQCIDLVMPNKAPGTAPDSNLIYTYGGKLYQAKYSPAMLPK